MSNVSHIIKSNFLKIQLQNKQEEFLHPSFLMETRLAYEIQSGNLAKALNILESINKDIRPKLSKIPIRSLKNSLICSCTIFTRAIIKGGVPAEKAFTLSDTCILEIEKCEDIDLLKQLEYDMLSLFTDLVNDEEELPYSNTVTQAITFIEDNLLKELKLQMIGDHCYVNPSYLSHLFKKEVGLSITQYINKKRVEEAKHLLIHTTYTISEIAGLFQFCNQSYFTAQFKKYKGMTPKEYRNRHVD